MMIIIHDATHFHWQTQEEEEGRGAFKHDLRLFSLFSLEEIKGRNFIVCVCVVHEGRRRKKNKRMEREERKKKNQEGIAFDFDFDVTCAPFLGLCVCVRVSLGKRMAVLKKLRVPVKTQFKRSATSQWDRELCECKERCRKI